MKKQVYQQKVYKKGVVTSCSCRRPSCCIRCITCASRCFEGALWPDIAPMNRYDFSRQRDVDLQRVDCVMPAVLGAFETSLRGHDSPRGDRRVLHKGCSGHLHGHGVKKERTSRTPEFKHSKTCCTYNDASSSDESTQPRRSQSSEDTRLPPPVTRRSNSATTNNVAQRLFSSPTMATTAKLRAERTASDGPKMASDLRSMGFGTSCLPRRLMTNKANKSEDDSGHFSSSEDNNDFHARNVVDLVSPAVNHKQNLINGTSDDELSMEELRRKQRQQRRDYLQHRQGGSRRQSPSPASSKRVSGEDRGRKSSDEASDSSFSPPASPVCRSSSGKMWPKSSGITTSGGKPRAQSSGGNSCAYAFGSSTKRFNTDEKLKGLKKFLPPPLNKSSSDGVEKGFKAAELALSRTFSDPKATSPYHLRHQSREKTEVTKAWLKFKEDIEAAMQKKPNRGYYKDLSDMMNTKMEMLSDEVQFG
jgi:hypothetical protein